MNALLIRYEFDNQNWFAICDELDYEFGIGKTKPEAEQDLLDNIRSLYKDLETENDLGPLLADVFQRLEASMFWTSTLG